MSTLSPSTEQAVLELVDAHHHLWNLERNHYPWLSDQYNPGTFMGDYRALCRDYGPAEFRADAAGFRLRASVHVEAEHDRAVPLRETEWLHEQHAQTGLPSAIVAYVKLDAPDCAEQLESQVAYSLVRGIRSKPLTTRSPEQRCIGAPGSMQDERWLNGLALLPKFHLSWDLRVPYWHLAEAADVAAALPQLAIALEHTGLPWNRSPEGLAVWRDGMARLAAQPNVHVKLSELAVPGQGWPREQNIALMREVIALFGIERCMFASNYPVASLYARYTDLVAAAQAVVADYGPAQRQAFFADNALAFYRIELDI